MLLIWFIFGKSVTGNTRVGLVFRVFRFSFKSDMLFVYCLRLVDANAAWWIGFRNNLLLWKVDFQIRAAQRL